MVTQKLSKLIGQLWNLLLYIIKKKPRPEKLRQYTNEKFKIILLPYWIEYIDKNNKKKIRDVCFYNSKTSNGTLQIWTFTWEKELKNHSNSMFKKFLIYDMKRRLKGLKIPYIKNLVKLYEIQNHFFAETSFKNDGNFWRLWSVTTKKKSAHISYNYQLKYPDVNMKEVSTIVKSFRFVET